MAKRKIETAGSMKFESALEKLEKIVEEMESGNLPLEEILKKYEEGSALVNYCAKKLSEAEKRIEILMKNKEGNLVPRPFEQTGPSGQMEETGGESREDDKHKSDEELF